MDFFEKYTSNTCAGTSNQNCFEMEQGEVLTGRVFYKIFHGGRYNYSMLFSNTIDGTFRETSANFVCDEWKILNARVGRCKYIPADKLPEELNISDDGLCSDIVVEDFKPLTFL